jgi:hypothetical protein
MQKRKIEESEQRLMADLMPAKINNALVDGVFTILINTG